MVRYGTVFGSPDRWCTYLRNPQYLNPIRQEGRMKNDLLKPEMANPIEIN
jgi:hypothetical protein